MTHEILVTGATGATGKTGRRVLHRLHARNPPVRAGSRATDPPFDWDDPETWTPTVIRASWFNQNFSEGHLLEPVLAGMIALPAADVPEPFVDTNDSAGIADIAVAALTGDGHAGQTYEVTGPRPLTFADAAAEIAAATGRPVTYHPMSPMDYERVLTGVGLPAADAGHLTRLFSEVLDGRNAHLTDGVRRALGREPRDFTDYVRAAATTGVWSAR